eukprot:4471736-Ditylum_brightwellii.AAC.1
MGTNVSRDTSAAHAPHQERATNVRQLVTTSWVEVKQTRAGCLVQMNDKASQQGRVVIINT